MKKSDLIPFEDYVQTRNGNMYYFVGSGFIAKYCHIPINSYNEELLSTDGDSNLDVINVYRINSQLSFGNIDKIVNENLKSIKDGDVSPILWRNEIGKKQKLSHDEYIILKNLDRKYKWIARDEQGDLCLYNKQPNRVSKCWFGSNIYFQFFSMYGHMFQFVQWENEAPYYIPDLLKEYEDHNKAEEE